MNPFTTKEFETLINSKLNIFIIPKATLAHGTHAIPLDLSGVDLKRFCLGEECKISYTGSHNSLALLGLYNI